MRAEGFWPFPEAFLDLSEIPQITDGKARCTGIAICDADGSPARIFSQGQEVHFFYEFAILHEIGVLSGGLEFCDATGRVIHGKNTFQYETSGVQTVQAGKRLRYHHIISLEVSSGEYWFSIGLASTDESSYSGYREKVLSHEEFAHFVHEHCRVVRAGSFKVQLDSTGQLLHHGIANLPGSCRVSVVESKLPLFPSFDLRESAERAVSTILQAPKAGARWIHRTLRTRTNAEKAMPTVFHVTHWKAGSQWIHKILRACAPEHIVAPQVSEVQFLNWPLQPGKVYPTVYVTKQQFDKVQLPANWRRFVIIRDLRDTLVSAYFSMKVSHPVVWDGISQLRGILQSVSLEEGMLYMIEEWLPSCAHIQMSWLETSERLIRYEDLLEHDLEILESLLLDECRLPISRKRFRAVVQANRFEQFTQGRKRGQEDITAHERKGIVGDWRNYFTERVKQAFKIRYGGLLVATGYERDLQW